MSPMEKQETAAPSKVYYVITRKYANRFLGVRSSDGRGPWKKAPHEALQYSSIEAVVRFLMNLGSGSDAQGISKITETPAGPPTIRLVSTRTIDATKPCVIFCSDRKKYTVLVGEQLGYFPYQGGELSQAALFIDLNEALRAIAVSAAAWRSKGHKDIGHKNLHVHQVEIIPGAPVITETVLS